MNEGRIMLGSFKSIFGLAQGTFKPSGPQGKAQSGMQTPDTLNGVPPEIARWKQNGSFVDGLAGGGWSSGDSGGFFGALSNQ
jgi:hypothetical protein